MQPSPISETCKPLFPSLRVRIAIPSGFCFPSSRIKTKAMAAVSRSFRFLAYFSRRLARLFTSEGSGDYPEE
jgi:hypothetical protein